LPSWPRASRPGVLQPRAGAAFPRPHRAAGSRAQCLRHRHGRPGPRRRPPRGRVAGEGRGWAPHRSAHRPQGHLLHRRHPHHLLVTDAGGFRRPVRRDGRRALARRGHRAARQDEHGRVRDGLVERDELLRPGEEPLGPARVPGGSSGGSAAAVAACLAPAASGTDTGGSIRQPAALTNLTGLKPTYGRVSRYGMIAFASSLDQGGMLTRSAEDAALLLKAMAGFDPRDSTSVDAPVPDYVAELAAPLAGLRVGVIREFFDTAWSRASASSCRTRSRCCAPTARRCLRSACPPAAVGADLLRGRAGRMLLEPVAIRRRPLRAPLRRAARPARPLQALARRGFRRRGQAPHHDRHLRAVGGLLRRLLPQGAEGAAADRGRFRPGVRRGGRRDRPDVAHAGVRARRQDQRPDHDVPERHLHDRCKPRGPARDLHPLRLRAGGRQGPAGGTAADRPAFFRVAAAVGVAPVPAVDGLAPRVPPGYE
jgi:hypothetical protein